MPRRVKKVNPAGPSNKRPRRQVNHEEENGNEKERRTQRSWTQKQTTTILEYLKDTISLGLEIEKPTAPTYYKSFLQKNRALPNAEDHLAPDITVPMIITHVNNVKRSYGRTLKWSKETGQGVKETMEAETFKGVLLKKCKYYDLCEEVWGHRKTFDLPPVAETIQVGRPRRSSALYDSEPEENDNAGDDDYIPPSPRSRSVSRERSLSPFPRSPGSPHGSPERSPPRTTTQRSTKETPATEGSYSRPRSKVKSRGHPGRKLDKGGEKLSNSFYPKGPKQEYDNIVYQREVNDAKRIKFQEEQLKLQQQQVNNESRRLDDELELKRQQFEYTKQKDAQALDFEREITRRQELKIEEMKLKLELAKLGIPTNID